MGNFFTGLAQTAVKAAPFAADVLARREAKQKADMAAALAQLHQQSQDNTASVLANIRAGEGLATIDKMHAEATKLREPTPRIQRGPGGQLVRISDDGTTENIGPAPTPKAPAAPRIVPIVANGKRVYSNAADAVGKEAPAPSAPQEPAGVFVSDPANPNAPPVYTKRGDAYGKIKPPTGTGEGGGMGGMGSGGIGGLARTSSGITEMDQADQMMRPFEENVRTGKANYNGLDYFQGQMAKMYDAHGKVDQAIHATTFSNLDKTNPDLANYLRAAEAWALADGTISGRTSDFRTRMDAFVSAIGPNASAPHIDQVQRFRGTRVNELKKFQPAMQAMGDRITAGRGRGNQSPDQPPPNVPHARGAHDPGGDINLGKITPAERAALKAKGFSDQQITAKYGPP